MMSYDADYLLKAIWQSLVLIWFLFFGRGGFLVALGTGKLETQPRIPQAAGAWRFGLAGRSGGLWEVKKTSSPCKTAC
jgi:hypothetical protein